MGNWFVRHHARSRAFFLCAAASCEDAFWFHAGMEIVDEPQDSGGSAAANDRSYKNGRGYQFVATRVL